MNNGSEAYLLVNSNEQLLKGSYWMFLSMLFLVGGVLSFATNSVLAAVVFANAYLRNKSAFLLALLALSDSAQGAGLAYTAVSYLLSRRLVGYWPCFVVYISFSFWLRTITEQISPAVLLCLVIDRGVIILNPNHYATLGRKTYVSGFVISVIGYAALCTTFLARNIVQQSVAYCERDSLISGQAQSLTTAAAIILGLLIISGNACARCAATTRQQGDKWIGSNSRMRHFQRSLSTLFSIFSATWLVLVVVVVASVSVTQSPLNLQLFPHRVAYFITNLLFIINSSSHFFLFYCGNSEYRSGFRRLCGIKQPTITHTAVFSTHSSQQHPHQHQHHQLHQHHRHRESYDTQHQDHHVRHQDRLHPHYQHHQQRLHPATSSTLQSKF